MADENAQQIIVDWTLHRVGNEQEEVGKVGGWDRHHAKHVHIFVWIPSAPYVQNVIHEWHAQKENLVEVCHNQQRSRPEKQHRDEISRMAMVKMLLGSTEIHVHKVNVYEKIDAEAFKVGKVCEDSPVFALFADNWEAQADRQWGQDIQADANGKRGAQCEIGPCDDGNVKIPFLEREAIHFE